MVREQAIKYIDAHYAGRAVRLAEDAGIHESTLSRFLNGKTKRVPADLADFLQEHATAYRGDAELIRHARKLAGRSVEEMADRAGVTPETWRRVESGEMQPPASILARLSEATGVELRDDAVLVPLLDQLVSAGSGAFSADPETVADRIPVPRAVVRRLGGDASRLAWVTVEGDSMEPTIQAGQQVLVVRHDGGQPRHRSIYVCDVADALVIKRLYVEPPDRWILRGDGETEADAYTYEGDTRQSLRIVGRVAYTGTYL